MKTEKQTYGTQVLTSVTKKITIFWDVTMCSSVQVNFYQTTWSYIILMGRFKVLMVVRIMM